MELEKLERKDPLKKFSEKVAVQKALVGRESPRRSSGQSPSAGSPSRQSNKMSPIRASTANMKSPK